MIFDPKNYINPNEIVVLTGNCYPNANCQTTVNYILTTRKLVQAGANHLIVIPLNKISCISDNGVITSVSSTQGCMGFYHGGHPEWYAALQKELALRLG